jgi:hypothetical protein
MAARYATGTDVSTDRSRSEIERTVRRYGAAEFAYGWNAGRAVVGFTANGRSVRFVLPMPDPAEPRFTLTPTGKRRVPSAAEAEYEAAVRQIWRVFALVIKAKLEAVESGLVEFEQEFLAHIVLPGGQTVGDTIGEKIAQAYETGAVPPLLPDYRRAIEGGR